MQTEKAKALIGLNVAVLIMSMAGVFAKLIPWHPALIILGRAALTAPFVGLYLVARNRSLKLKTKRHVYTVIGLGVMMVTHWVTFFSAIQASTVAIGILAVFTAPIITTFLEPLFDKTRIETLDIVVALAAFSGIALMIDDYSIGGAAFTGVGLGVCSAVLVSLRNIWSKPMVQEYSAPLIMFWQMVFGAIALLPLLLVFDASVTMPDVGNLLLLALFSTAIAHTLMLNSIGYLGARATSVIMMIQPLYAILLAVVLLGEIPSLRIIAGGALVVGASGFESLKQK